MPFSIGQNLTSINGVPGIYVNVQSPFPSISTVPSNVIGIVGAANYGPVNSPITTDFQNGILTFGKPNNALHDMMTQAYTANLQGANSFTFVRVTDGTDSASNALIFDTSTPTPYSGCGFSALYTGAGGNDIFAYITQGSSYTTVVPTWKVSIFMANGTPETFDNIGGTGSAIWSNLVNAINNGQSLTRGPSKLVLAVLNTGVTQVTINNPGSYTTIPSLTVVGTGTNALLQTKMQAINATVVAGGTGYTTGDVLTVVGGSHAITTTLQVNSVGGLGEVLTAIVLVQGSYTALPSNPATTAGGTGTGATFNLNWSILGANILNPGQNYTAGATTITVSGSGGGSATPQIGAPLAPAFANYQLLGGTSGANINGTTEVGTDTFPRTGMYTLRNSNIAYLILADATNPNDWAPIKTFCSEEGVQNFYTVAAGYQEDINGAIAIVNQSGVRGSGTTDGSFELKCGFGDWILMQDVYNNVQRLTSPQGWMAGTLAVYGPNSSVLNKPLVGALATQKSLDNRTYADDEITQIMNAGMELITVGIPRSSTAIGARCGVNMSTNNSIRFDGYAGMVNFLAKNIQNTMGNYVGESQNDDLRNAAKSQITTFLTSLANQNLIGDVNYPGDLTKAFRVTLDSTNNPPAQVAQGYMQVDCQVVLFQIVVYLVINLNADYTSNIQITTLTN